MSKVNTLLRLIAYQRQHPQAGDEEIAEGIGLSSRHVSRCRKEVNLLKHQLAEPYLQPGQIQFLLSLLKEHAPDQKEICPTTSKTDGRGPTPVACALRAPNRPGICGLARGRRVDFSRNGPFRQAASWY